jgi:serine/threonine protein phosphatase PrpC
LIKDAPYFALFFILRKISSPIMTRFRLPVHTVALAISKRVGHIVDGRQHIFLWLATLVVAALKTPLLFLTRTHHQQYPVPLSGTTIIYIMFSKWIVSAFGQTVAPDEKHVDDFREPGGLGFWSIVAPDPIYEELAAVQEDEAAPCPPNALAVGDRGPPVEAFNLFECPNCHTVSPFRQSTTNHSRFKTPDRATVSFHPEASNDGKTKEMREAEEGSLSANRATNLYHPTDKSREVLNLCSSSVPLNEKSQKKLRKIIKNDTELTKARAKNMVHQARDGQTPLMTAAANGNLAAAQIVMEMDDTAHLDRDLSGATALHIAAHEGHPEMVQLLMPQYPKVENLVDINGKTPLGLAMISPRPKAQENRQQMTQQLFSPVDISLRGTPAPPVQRERVIPSLQMSYGMSEMAGHRILMEDSTCTIVGQDYCFLGVFDGHGDSRQVSSYVAKEVAKLVDQHMRENSITRPPWQELWTSTCLEVDKMLGKTARPGGSTAVMALITQTEIVVVNVGDSRCILVQKGQGGDVIATNENDPPALVDEPNIVATDDATPVPDTAETDPEHAVQIEPSTPNSYTVVAMSEDHKPNLQDERKRIENAKLKVVAEVLREPDGTETTFHKVELSASNMLAVSRAFGDFEYKNSKDLAPEEQAVIAVPEVRVHRRDAEKDMYIILACDGVWDVMSNDDVAKFVVDGMPTSDPKSFRAGGLLPKVGDDLLDECFRLGSKDNMTAVLADISSNNMNRGAGATNIIKPTRLPFEQK